MRLGRISFALASELGAPSLPRSVERSAHRLISLVPDRRCHLHRKTCIAKKMAGHHPSSPFRKGVERIVTGVPLFIWCKKIVISEACVCDLRCERRVTGEPCLRAKNASSALLPAPRPSFCLSPFNKTFQRAFYLASSSVLMMSESPGSVMESDDTRKSLPQAVPRSTLSASEGTISQL